jgi:hypothetical protein
VRGLTPLLWRANDMSCSEFFWLNREGDEQKGPRQMWALATVSPCISHFAKLADELYRELSDDCLNEQPEATPAETDGDLAVLQEVVRESGEHKARLLSFHVLMTHFTVWRREPATEQGV